jgi:pimeloyl-ACP methyl ester carboxylesterase
MNQAKKEIQLESGTIRYREAGAGPPLVFVHGYLVDGRLWDGVVDRLADRFRCIAPDWPMGAHTIPMNPDADLTPYGFAATVSDLLEKLDLDDVTIVANDSGGAMSQVLVTRHPQRVGRLVLTNCDTYENFPPGIFKFLPPLAKLPGGMQVIAAPFRIPAVARAAFRPFTKRPIPPELIASWMAASAADAEIRRDLKKLTVTMHRRYTMEAAERLRGSELPILFPWAPGDKLFPISAAERLAGSVQNAKIVPIEGASTFVSLDQPQRVAEEIAQFAGTG